MLGAYFLVMLTFRSAWWSTGHSLSEIETQSAKERVDDGWFCLWRQLLVACFFARLFIGLNAQHVDRDEQAGHHENERKAHSQSGTARMAEKAMEIQKAAR